jgi:hypothetical protein
MTTLLYVSGIVILVWLATHLVHYALESARRSLAIQRGAADNEARRE